MAKQISIDELNRLYDASEQMDQEIFAEQRSNVLLVSGDHFSKRSSRFWNRITNAKAISEDTKLRLTKNHLHKITRLYANGINSYAPGVTVSPKNENELQDQKAAELHNSVWNHIKQSHNMRRRVREFVQDFIDIGECAAKVFWDYTKGQFVGYEAEVDEMGQPLIDPLTQMPIESDRAVFSGDLVIERVFGFNLFRSPEAKSMRDAKFLGCRKMVDIDLLKKSVGDDEEKLKFITDSSDETYTVFDQNKADYYQTKDQCLVREFYYRRSPEYPLGYFYIATKAGILFEGDLGMGPNKEYLFPIIYEGFDEIQTTPRARSIIRQLRPYQVEINRASSKIAETQISSDDKLLIQHGSKISQGAQLPGIRAVQYSGAPPVFLQGRAGEQYLAYLQSQISEMYQVANVAEDAEEKQTQLDPHAMLYRSIRNKKKFSIYAEKIEQFLIDLCTTSLTLYKAHASEQALIPLVGRREFVNIPEFKSAQNVGYVVKIEAQDDDAETKIGRLLTMQTVIQYAGNKLDKDDLGKLIKLSAYANKEEAFSDLTLDYDCATNDILALDRGEYRPPNRHDNHPYILKRLVSRMKQADFPFLPPQIQQLYQQKLQAHEQMEADLQAQALAAKSEYIPVGGYMVGCDFYVNDPDNKFKTRRARVPYQALDWLIHNLEAQGMSLSKLEAMDVGMQADFATHIQNSLSQRGVNGAGPIPGPTLPLANPSGQSSPAFRM